MGPLTISVTVCVSLFSMSAGALAWDPASGPRPHEGRCDSPRRTQILEPATPPMIGSGTTVHPYSYVPKPPQNPYGSSTNVQPYAVPTAPRNRYPSSTAPHYTPATQALVPIGSAYAAPTYAVKCVINEAGDFCTGSVSSPVSSGTACTCDRYNGYTQ
jgi:hypothetical protein